MFNLSIIQCNRNSQAIFHTRNIDFFYEIDFIIINRVISLIMKINVDVYDYVDFINDFHAGKFH